MKVTVCRCRECGRYHAFEKFGVRDVHVCECGERIERWTHEMHECEVKDGPSEPCRKESMARQNHREPKYPVKGITVELDCKTTEDFNETMDILREAQQLKTPVIIPNNTKALLFKTDMKPEPVVVEQLRTVLEEKLGINCLVINSNIELAGIVRGEKPDDSD